MTTPAYYQLARRLNKLPMKALINDKLLEILALLFTEEEAEIISRAPLRPSTAEKIAQKSGRPVTEVRPRLDNLASQGLIAAGGEVERRYFVLAFMPGIYESYMALGKDDEKKRRFAELYESYYNADFARNAVKRPVTVGRIIPVEASVPNAIGILPADHFRAAADRHDAWSVTICACRKQNELIGRGCDKPKEVCMQFGNAARGAAKSGVSRLVSREEIMDLIDQAEAAGLVHFTDNVEFPHLSCNCCGCCCDALASLTRFNTPAVFARSRYRVCHAEDKCTACAQCASACPVGALHLYNNKVIFEPARCIGCGVCISRCRHGALQLTLRPESLPVPKNYGQMIVSSGTELLGLKNLAYSLAPRFTRLLGDWIQNGMDKMIAKNKKEAR